MGNPWWNYEPNTCFPTEPTSHELKQKPNPSLPYSMRRKTCPHHRLNFIQVPTTKLNIEKLILYLCDGHKRFNLLRDPGPIRYHTSSNHSLSSLTPLQKHQNALPKTKNPFQGAVILSWTEKHSHFCKFAGLTLISDSYWCARVMV